MESFAIKSLRIYLVSLLVFHSYLPDYILSHLGYWEICFNTLSFLYKDKLTNKQRLTLLSTLAVSSLLPLTEAKCFSVVSAHLVTFLSGILAFISH